MGIIDYMTFLFWFTNMTNQNQCSKYLDSLLKLDRSNNVSDWFLNGYLIRFGSSAGNSKGL